MPGDNVEMTVELIHPVAMEEGLRFAIREEMCIRDSCLYMGEHYSLQRQRSYSDSEEESRKNNSDAEGIRTV